MRRTSESLKLVLYQFSDYIFVIDNLNVTSWEKFQVSIKNLSVKKCFITISKDYVLLENDIYILCANVLLTKGVLHLHSSFVLYKDKALVFTAPSGIGKTTQAELWRDFQGALIVNGGRLSPPADGRRLARLRDPRPRQQPLLRKPGGAAVGAGGAEAGEGKPAGTAGRFFCPV